MWWSVSTLTFAICMLFSFLSKTSGQILNLDWVRQAGSIGCSSDPFATCNDEGWSAALDDNNNIIVTGEFEDSLSIGDTLLNGDRNIFIAKYNMNGDFLWAQQVGGLQTDRGWDIATDFNNNIFMIGTVSSDTVNVADTTLIKLGEADIIVVKYNENGELRWARQGGGLSSYAGGYAITTDEFGNAVITGTIEGTISFADTSLTSAGFEDVFIAKYAHNGDFLWARRAGGSDFDEGNGIAIDIDNNIVVVGDFDGSADFGDTTITGDRNIFVAKYNSAGTFIWVRNMGGIDRDHGEDVAVGIANNIVLAGYFNGSATFIDTTLTSEGDEDIVLVQFDSNGNLLWAQRAGGADIDEGEGIATDINGNITIAGRFDDDATIGDTLLIGDGYFIAEYDPNGILIFAHNATSAAINDVKKSGTSDFFITGRFYEVATFGDTTILGISDDDIFVAKYSENVTGINTANDYFHSFNLSQNYPNPFNPTTSIEYAISSRQFVSLKVYDILGAEIATLIHEEKPAGEYIFQFDASKLSSGIYFYQLQAGGFTETKKMILMR